jgi:hypothetical protein
MLFQVGSVPSLKEPIISVLNPHVTAQSHLRVCFSPHFYTTDRNFGRNLPSLYWITKPEQCTPTSQLTHPFVLELRSRHVELAMIDMVVRAGFSPSKKRMCLAHIGDSLTLSEPVSTAIRLEKSFGRLDMSSRLTNSTAHFWKCFALLEIHIFDHLKEDCNSLDRHSVAADSFL